MLDKIFEKLLDYLSPRLFIFLFFNALAVTAAIYVPWRLGYIRIRDFEDLVIKTVLLEAIVLLIHSAWKRRETVRARKEMRDKFYANVNENVKKIQMALNEDSLKVDLDEYFVPPYLKLASTDAAADKLDRGTFDLRLALKRAKDREQNGVVIIGGGERGRPFLRSG